MNSRSATRNSTVSDATEQVFQTSRPSLKFAAQPLASGSDKLRRQAGQLLAIAVQPGDSTPGHVQHVPLKAVLMVLAAVGAAALMWLVSLLGHLGLG